MCVVCLVLLFVFYCRSIHKYKKLVDSGIHSQYTVSKIHVGYNLRFFLKIE